MATPIPDNVASFTLAEIASATRGTIARPGAPSAEAAVGVTSDSRAVTPGNVFVALRGGSYDGHAFAAAAAERGARAVVVERGRGLSLPPEAGVIEVDDTLLAWGDLARAHLEAWRAGARDRRVVAITGSAGKTTTKELTVALLEEVAATHGTAGNLNNRVGVPAVVFGLTDRHRFCVLEMGMSLPGELDAITSIARPDVSIVVNVGIAHTEGVGGVGGVTHEKGAVYRALADGGVAIVNADDARVRRAAELARARKRVTFGRGAGGLDDAPAYQLLERAPEGGGSRVVASCAGRRLELSFPLPGEAAAIDLLAALAAQEAASSVPLSAEAIERALGRVHLSGRGALRRLAHGVLLLDDTYNANPSSMRASLSTLAEIAGGRRKVAVLGEMRELGAAAEAEHDALGDAIADAGVALAVGCGGLMGRALGRAAARGVDVVHGADTPEAARELAARVRPGDVVLAKGSRGVRVELAVEALVARLARP